MAHIRTTELRVELPADEVAVLDGFCAATGENRTVVVRRLLREWSDKKLHEATLILRVAGVHPVGSDGDRGTDARRGGV
jgi:hypothetical protein